MAIGLQLQGLCGQALFCFLEHNYVLSAIHIATFMVLLLLIEHNYLNIYIKLIFIKNMLMNFLFVSLFSCPVVTNVSCATRAQHH